MAANWLKDVVNLEGMAGKLIGGIADISEKHLGKKELELAKTEINRDVRVLVETLAHEEAKARLEHATAIIGAKERVLVAELKQDDPWTKRARPFVIYSGPVLALILIASHYIAVFSGAEIPPPPGIEWFVSGWSGCFATYAISRTVDKKNGTGKLASVARAVTGGAKPSSILDS